MEFFENDDVTRSNLTPIVFEKFCSLNGFIEYVWTAGKNGEKFADTYGRANTIQKRYVRAEKTEKNAFSNENARGYL